MQPYNGDHLHRFEGRAGTIAERTSILENTRGGGYLGPAESARRRTAHLHAVGAFPLRAARQRASGCPRGDASARPQDSIPTDVGTIQKGAARVATDASQRG